MTRYRNLVILPIVSSPAMATAEFLGWSGHGDGSTSAGAIGLVLSYLEVILSAEVIIDDADIVTGHYCLEVHMQNKERCLW